MVQGTDGIGGGTATGSGDEVVTEETTVEEGAAVEAQETTDTPSLQQIDWSKVNVEDIPKDVLEKHPAYKNVLGESIERRKQIAELTKQLNSTPETQNTDTADDDPFEARFSRLENAIGKMLDLQVQRDTNEARRTLATKYNVPDARVDYIRGDTLEEMEASAKVLGEPRGGVSGNTSPGNGGSGGDVKGALRQRIRSRAEDRGTESSSIFDVGVQRQRGGGPI